MCDHAIKEVQQFIVTKTNKADTSKKDRIENIAGYKSGVEELIIFLFFFIDRL